jgi:hypothetical protein
MKSWFGISLVALVGLLAGAAVAEGPGRVTDPGVRPIKTEFAVVQVNGEFYGMDTNGMFLAEHKDAGLLGHAKWEADGRFTIAAADARFTKLRHFKRGKPEPRWDLVGDGSSVDLEATTPVTGRIDLSSKEGRRLKDLPQALGFPVIELDGKFKVTYRAPGAKPVVSTIGASLIGGAWDMSWPKPYPNPTKFDLFQIKVAEPHLVWTFSTETAPVHAALPR